ncbi:unnamed protein product [Prorocentrum cordatum]|uniref:Uncharacterized protein n=1 Tax=Prorocentrum cordatum TaxID=2364126 RepID=A0ABN9W7P6_9DINO|nr:unnamed protein product [Polarella glacialis]
MRDAEYPFLICDELALPLFEAATSTAIIELCFWLLKRGQVQLGLSVTPGARQRPRTDECLMPLGPAITLHDEAWGAHAIDLLTMTGFSMSGSVVDLRPITLLPVIYKWRSHSLRLLLGGPAAPFLFNLRLDALIDVFARRCERRGWGWGFRWQVFLLDAPGFYARRSKRWSAADKAMPASSAPEGVSGSCGRERAATSGNRSPLFLESEVEAVLPQTPSTAAADHPGACTPVRDLLTGNPWVIAAGETLPNRLSDVIITAEVRVDKLKYACEEASKNVPPSAGYTETMIMECISDFMSSDAAPLLAWESETAERGCAREGVDHSPAAGFARVAARPPAAALPPEAARERRARGACNGGEVLATPAPGGPRVGVQRDGRAADLAIEDGEDGAGEGGGEGSFEEIGLRPVAAARRPLALGAAAPPAPVAADRARWRPAAPPRARRGRARGLVEIAQLRREESLRRAEKALEAEQQLLGEARHRHAVGQARGLVEIGRHLAPAEGIGEAVAPASFSMGGGAEGGCQSMCAGQCEAPLRRSMCAAFSSELCRSISAVSGHDAGVPGPGGGALVPERADGRRRSARAPSPMKAEAFRLSLSQEPRPLAPGEPPPPIASGPVADPGRMLDAGYCPKEICPGPSSLLTCTDLALSGLGWQDIERLWAQKTRLDGLFDSGRGDLYRRAREQARPISPRCAPLPRPVGPHPNRLAEFYAVHP